LRDNHFVRFLIQKPFQLSHFCSKLSEIWFRDDFHSCVFHVIALEVRLRGGGFNAEDGHDYRPPRRLTAAAIRRKQGAGEIHGQPLERQPARPGAIEPLRLYHTLPFVAVETAEYV
jgi:hypothetical protein